jgi:hypothetical protein
MASCVATIESINESDSDQIKVPHIRGQDYGVFWGYRHHLSSLAVPRTVELLDGRTDGVLTVRAHITAPMYGVTPPRVLHIDRCFRAAAINTLLRLYGRTRRTHSHACRKIINQ